MLRSTGAQSPAAASNIGTIQYLRALAALMVVWHHAVGQVDNFPKYLPVSNAGVSGVDLFFVISGFIMVLTTHGKSSTPWQFMRRRIVRVVPLYWILTLLVLVLAEALPSLFKTTQAPWWHVVNSLLFIPHFSPSHPGMPWPLIVPGWTLNYEMFFYLVFAASLWLPSRAQLAAVALFMSALVLLGATAGPFSSAPMQVYTRYLLVEFVIGMLLARWWLARGAGLPLSWSAPMIVAGIYLLLTRDVGVLGEYTQVVGAGLTVAGALSPRLLHIHHPLALALGNASYSTYLTHLFTLGALRFAWTRLLPEADGALWAWAFMVTALTCSHVVGWLAMRSIEQPLLKALR